MKCSYILVIYKRIARMLGGKWNWKCPLWGQRIQVSEFSGPQVWVVFLSCKLHLILFICKSENLHTLSANLLTSVTSRRLSQLLEQLFKWCLGWTGSDSQSQCRHRWRHCRYSLKFLRQRVSTSSAKLQQLALQAAPLLWTGKQCLLRLASNGRKRKKRTPPLRTPTTHSSQSR